MDISWRNYPSVIRVCSVRAVVLFAAAGITTLAAANEDCAIRDLESVRKLDLDACRPAPVAVAERAAVLQSLPVNGALSQFGRGERRKLGAIDRVLRAHGRTGIYAVKVISVPTGVGRSARESGSVDLSPNLETGDLGRACGACGPRNRT